MNIDFFSNISWCDLGIVILRIYSKSIMRSNKILICDENPDLTKTLPIVNVYICSDNDSVFNTTEYYREKIMAKGLYLGHHFGEAAKYRMLDDHNFAICHSDPCEIIRCYISKYVLNIFALKQHILYLKGGAVEYKGRAFLILGRGGSGKTEMINTLCRNTARFISNTHLLIDSFKVKGINSIIRVRKDGKDEFVSVAELHGENTCFDYTPICGIFWIKYKEGENGYIRELQPEELFYNMQFFSEATINWEMKEDIADYCKSDPYIFKRVILSIHDRLKEITKIKSYYLNLDIYSSDGIEKTVRLMDKLIVENL